MCGIAVETARITTIFKQLCNLWQSSGPGGRVHFMIAEKSSDVKVKRSNSHFGAFRGLRSS